MTPDNDIERVLDQWFAEGPTQMPSRFFDDTLDRIDRTPKRRLVGLRPRVVHADPRRLVAAAAVVALVVAGIGAAVVLRAPAVGTNPSPSPSAGALSDPALLDGRWASVGSRHQPYQNGSHVLDTVNPTAIVIGDEHVQWDGLRAEAISSKSIVGPDTIELRTVAVPSGWDCQIGDVGTYRFNVSGQGQDLTLTPIADACAARQAVLAGEWVHADMGGMAPGRHVSGIVKPFGDAGGQFSYTVPAGWSNLQECTDCLTLGSIDDASRIHLYTNVAPSGPTGRCDVGTGTTPTDIAAWLGTLPSLRVTAPTAVAVGGLTGVQLDLRAIGDPATNACSFAQDIGGDVSLTDPNLPDSQVVVGSEGATRLILLDRGDGSTLLVDVDIRDEAAWNVLLAEAMPVVGSFEFARTVPGVVPATADRPSIASKWTSIGPRAYPGTTASDTTDIVIDATSLSINGFKGWVDSSWSAFGSDGLDLVTRTDQPSLTGQHWDCETGQEGIYTVAVSSDGKTMTLTPTDDACTTRAGILAGDWARWPCPNPLSSCQTELEPGRHVTDWHTPDGLVTTVLSSFSYTVPSGWSQLPNTTALARRNDPYSMQIAMTLDVAPHTQAADCADTPASGVGTTVAAMADWLTHVPGLVATTPIPITIDGYHGFTVDMSVSPTRNLSCQFTNLPRTVFTFTDPAPTVDDSLDTATIRTVLEGDAHSRYVLLDLGAGHNLLIEVSAPDKASWDEFVPAAMPIVDSLEFVR